MVNWGWGGRGFSLLLDRRLSVLLCENRVGTQIHRAAESEGPGLSRASGLRAKQASGKQTPESVRISSPHPSTKDLFSLEINCMASHLKTEGNQA
jgi:hypothetical protein